MHVRAYVRARAIYKIWNSRKELKNPVSVKVPLRQQSPTALLDNDGIQSNELFGYRKKDFKDEKIKRNTLRRKTT